jgi:hypothetical protein
MLYLPKVLTAQQVPEAHVLAALGVLAINLSQMRRFYVTWQIES